MSGTPLRNRRSDVLRIEGAPAIRGQGTAHNDLLSAARGNSLMKVSKDGGTATTLAPGANPVCIAVDATSVYWTNRSGATNADSVMKVSTDGSAPTILASGLKFAGAIAVDATSVYWTSGGGASSNVSHIGSVMKLTPK